MGEKQPKKREKKLAYAELEQLYGEIYDADMFVKEFSWSKDSCGAAVGLQRELVAALGLESVDDITVETIDSLPPFIPFAMPGSGATRAEAVRDAFVKMKQQVEKEEKVTKGECVDGSVYGAFTLGDTKVTAYLPNHEPDEWSVVIELPNEEAITRTLPMFHAPIFGPDVEDVAALNEFIEELIKEYELE